MLRPAQGARRPLRMGVPLEAGPHDVWITGDVAGDTVKAELVAVYDY